MVIGDSPHSILCPNIWILNLKTVEILPQRGPNTALSFTLQSFQGKVGRGTN